MPLDVPAKPAGPRSATEEKVLSVHHWTDRLFSFRCTRPASLRFEDLRQIAEERGAALQAMEAGMEEIRVAAEERQRVIIALDSDLRAALAVRPK